MILSALLLAAVAVNPATNPALLDRAVETFSQTCRSHLGDDEALVKSIAKASLSLVPNLRMKSQFIRQWIAPDVSLTFWVSGAMPLAYCEVDVAQTDQALTAARVATALNLTGGHTSTSGTGTITGWFEATADGKTRALAVRSNPLEPGHMKIIATLLPMALSPGRGSNPPTLSPEMP